MTTATMRTIWKTEPTKITSSFCASPVPAHRMRSGMNAEAGRYREKDKNATPSAIRAPGVTGLRGVKRLLDVARVDRAADVRYGLDDADLDEELARLLEEGLQLAGEELLVRRPILPAQVSGGFRERLAR